ncbi:MAG: DnaJ domain-containing protein, partial [Myxococcales bacterium]|nr:DnaJ domain-containing protein [Myxococcales bacterium]
MSDLSTHIPHLRTRPHLASLALEPREADVLEHIDGVRSVAEIADAVGLSHDDAIGVVQAFALRGFVELKEPGNHRRASGHPSAAPERVSSVRPSGSIPSPSMRSPSARPSMMYSMVDESREATRRSRAPKASDAANVRSMAPPAGGVPNADVELNDSAIEMSIEQRKEILDAFTRVQQSDYYAVLDLTPGAPKSEIRTAYFAFSKKFHPDTQYGRKIGPFKSRMEVIFRRVTEAYEVLGRAKTRTAYDRERGYPEPRPEPPKASTPSAAASTAPRARGAAGGAPPQTGKTTPGGVSAPAGPAVTKRPLAPAIPPAGGIPSNLRIHDVTHSTPATAPP